MKATGVYPRPFSLALYPHNVNKFVLIVLYLTLCGYHIVLSQQGFQQFFEQLLDPGGGLTSEMAVT
jgi:hypothetical protein